MAAAERPDSGKVRGRRRGGASRTTGRPWWQNLLRGPVGSEQVAGLRGLRFLIVGGGAVLVLVLLFVIIRGPGGRDPSVRLGFDDDPEASGFGPPTRSFALYFVDEDGTLVEERRELTAQQSRTEQLRVVVEELLAGSVFGYGAPVPAGTRLRNLFIGSDGIVYVDLTRDAVRGQPGNSSAEYASLVSLARTALANFPELVAVQVLIDGEPANTLAGHYAIDRPLVRADWTLP